MFAHDATAAQTIVDEFVARRLAVAMVATLQQDDVAHLAVGRVQIDVFGLFLGARRRGVAGWIDDGSWFGDGSGGGAASSGGLVFVVGLEFGNVLVGIYLLINYFSILIYLVRRRRNERRTLPDPIVADRWCLFCGWDHKRWC